MATKAELTTGSVSAATEHTEEPQLAELVTQEVPALVSAWSASTSSAATEHNAHHTHLAAVILDAAMERTALSGYPTAARKEPWFKNLKRDIIDLTFVPLTRCTLARLSAMPPGKKPRTGGIWPTCIESISRCVGAYHRAANATEHGKCDGIVDNIGAYAHTLCMRTDDPDQFVKLLHQWIENRSINMALRLCLDRRVAESSFWKFVNWEDQTRAFHLMETAVEIVRMNGDELRKCLDNLHTTT